MSIEQTKVVDAIGVEKSSGHVILTITDHLDWQNETEHLLLLQEKINAYLRFLESGEIVDSYPDANGRHAVISVVVLHEPTKVALEFLSTTKTVLAQAGFGFRVERSSPTQSGPSVVI